MWQEELRELIAEVRPIVRSLGEELETARTEKAADMVLLVSGGDAQVLQAFVDAEVQSEQGRVVQQALRRALTEARYRG